MNQRLCHKPAPLRSSDNWSAKRNKAQTTASDLSCVLIVVVSRFHFLLNWLESRQDSAGNYSGKSVPVVVVDTFSVKFEFAVRIIELARESYHTEASEINEVLFNE